MLEQYVKKILAAHVYDVAVETPLQHAKGISERLGDGYEVMLKREDLQPIFSFKLRGAYHKLNQLSARQRAKGVIAASAGNHAQGVALAARELGLQARIVMGRNTPDIKVSAVRRLGAEVVLHGDSYDEAAAQAKALAKAQGCVLVHPYDDAEVIAGQGTVGMEIMNQHPGPDAVFVPVGGGGLIAGIGAYVKYLRPRTRVLGVEAEGSACLRSALAAGRRVRLPLHSLDRFADGVSVAQVGRLPFKIAQQCVDEVVTVSTDEICGAIKDVFDDTRSVAEPSGALAVAGLKKYVQAHGAERRRGRRFVAVISGANVNFDRLRHVAERAEVGERREVILGVTIEERHGSFRRFCHALGDHAVTEFNYRFADADEAHVYVGVQVASADGRGALVRRLRGAGYPVVDMTDNETAKLHVRHMVGGHAIRFRPELLYRFEFPERPGALMQFLDGLGSRWSISLFHYRNHGSAWGRVLAGFDADAGQRGQLSAYLDRIGYRYWEETDNPAYELFLR